jgi:hypothetical protein
VSDLVWSAPDSNPTDLQDTAQVAGLERHVEGIAALRHRLRRLGAIAAPNHDPSMRRTRTGTPCPSHMIGKASSCCARLLRGRWHRIPDRRLSLPCRHSLNTMLQAPHSATECPSSAAAGMSLRGGDGGRLDHVGRLAVCDGTERQSPSVRPRSTARPATPRIRSSECRSRSVSLTIGSSAFWWMVAGGVPSLGQETPSANRSARAALRRDVSLRRRADSDDRARSLRSRCCHQTANALST